jgi:riboflavin synthase
MFTGIVTAIGVVKSVAAIDGGRRLVITAPWTDLVPGESVAVDGACLTVEWHGDGAFVATVVAASLARTTLGQREAGDRVNLERALAVGERMGGHWVQGHVDGVGTVVAVEAAGADRRLTVQVPPAVARVSVPQGSIAVNGVSLTVNAVEAPDRVVVALVPFTLEHTTLGALAPGDAVQLEGDLVGKHVQAQLEARQGGRP